MAMGCAVQVSETREGELTLPSGVHRVCLHQDDHLLFKGKLVKKSLKVHS